MTLEFNITRRGRGYVLLDDGDVPHVDETFATVEAAADTALRFAQEVRSDGAFVPYRITYPLSHGLA